MIELPQQLNPKNFSSSIKEPEVKYGLPSEVLYCKRCVISNQRPNSAVEFFNTRNSKKATINFDEEGVCDACRFAEKKMSTIDWTIRRQELKELCDRFRRDDGGYDCLVPGSGGKDSFFASWFLKHEMKMHPLTVTWAPHIYTEWGRKNFDSWIHAGFDNHLVTPNGRVHRLLTRLAVENLFHPFQPFMIGQKGLAPKLAKALNIPLVFYGENEAEYGNPIADADSARRDAAYFSRGDDEIFLGGVSVRQLKEDFGLCSNDLELYKPIDSLLLEESDIEVHYLGYYTKWHPQECFYLASEKGGFLPSPERTAGTYSKYNSIDDKIDDLHYYTTGVKFGLGRASYDAAQEIRSGDISRDEGVALVHRYDHEFPARFAKELYDYLSIDPSEFPVAYTMFEQWEMDASYFQDLANSFRSPHLWVQQGDSWKLRHPVS